MSEKTWYPQQYISRIQSLQDRPLGMSAQFLELLKVMNSHALSEEREMEVTTRANYDFWEAHVTLLKREFNQCVKLFADIEESVRGWYGVSPNDAEWGALGVGQNGYTFAACVTKNHKRHAPLSQKSLTVGFAVDGHYRGVGDERMLGRSSKLTDELVGLEQCVADSPEMSIKERYEASRRMNNFLAEHRLFFRLNHHILGQETTIMSVDILQQFTLVDLAERLYWALNQDVLTDVTKELPETRQFLLDYE